VFFFNINIFLNYCLLISIIGIARHDCPFLRPSSQKRVATAKTTRFARFLFKSKILLVQIQSVLGSSVLAQM
jgi:hypothetical protein